MAKRYDIKYSPGDAPIKKKDFWYLDQEGKCFKGNLHAVSVAIEVAKKLLSDGFVDGKVKCVGYSGFLDEVFFKYELELNDVDKVVDKYVEVKGDPLSFDPILSIGNFLWPSLNPDECKCTSPLKLNLQDSTYRIELHRVFTGFKVGIISGNSCAILDRDTLILEEMMGSLGITEQEAREVWTLVLNKLQETRVFYS